MLVEVNGTNYAAMHNPCKKPLSKEGIDKGAVGAYNKDAVNGIGLFRISHEHGGVALAQLP